MYSRGIFQRCEKKSQIVGEKGAQKIKIIRRDLRIEKKRLITSGKRKNDDFIKMWKNKAVRYNHLWRDEHRKLYYC